MIGTKLYKGKKSDMAKYTNTAVWCNANNAHIVDQGDYYEVVENEVVEVDAPTEPTLDERVTTLESENAALKADNISMNDTMLAIVEMLDIASE